MALCPLGEVGRETGGMRWGRGGREGVVRGGLHMEISQGGEAGGM